MKATIVSLGLVVFAALLGAFVLRGTERSREVPPLASVAVPFTPIASGAHSGIDRRVNYVVSSRDALHELWRMAKVTTPEPSVDFDREVVAAVFAGPQPTAGYGITVAKVEDADARVVTVVISKPDTTCVTASSITTPFEIITLPKTALPFLHEDEWATTTCTP